MIQQFHLESRFIADDLAPVMFFLGVRKELAPFEHTHVYEIGARHAPKTRCWFLGVI